MNIDQFRKRFADESTCRHFFESILWRHGRHCPHCYCSKSYRLSCKSTRAGLYECAQCKKQFTVTTKTPMHSTKLPLWKWLLAMYYIANSSKGVSSVFLGHWSGISQKSTWMPAQKNFKRRHHEFKTFLWVIVPLKKGLDAPICIYRTVVHSSGDTLLNFV